jgi:hypothetical protein
VIDFSVTHRLVTAISNACCRTAALRWAVIAPHLARLVRAIAHEHILLSSFSISYRSPHAGGWPAQGGPMTTWIGQPQRRWY